MIAAVLFPASLGACAFFTVLSVLEGSDPLLRVGTIVSGALAVLFGALFFPKFKRSGRHSNGRSERVRRILFATALTGAVAFVTYAAFDCGSLLAKHSTPDALIGKREAIMAEALRVNELERIVQEQPQNSLRKNELENNRKIIARDENELAIYETAGVRLAAVVGICAMLGLAAFVAWTFALRSLLTRAAPEIASRIAIEPQSAPATN